MVSNWVEGFAGWGQAIPENAQISKTAAKATDEAFRRKA